MKRTKWNRIEWYDTEGMEYSRSVKSVFTLAIVPKGLVEKLYGIVIGVVVSDKKSTLLTEISESMPKKKELIGTLVSYGGSSMPVVIQAANGKTSTRPTACIFCYVHPELIAGDKAP